MKDGDGELARYGLFGLTGLDCSMKEKERGGIEKEVKRDIRDIYVGTEGRVFAPCTEAAVWW